MNFNEVRPVFVEWVDSGSQRGWCDVDGLSKVNMLCKTLGWLIAETEDAIVISPALSFDVPPERINQVHSPMTIPRVAVKVMERLTLPGAKE